MRHRVLAAVLAFAFASVDATAADSVNRIDPISGKAVDGKSTLTVQVDGREVVVGFADAASADAAKKLRAAEQDLLARAASQNKTVRDGKVVDRK